MVLGLLILYVTVAANYIRFNDTVQKLLIRSPVLSYILLFFMSFLIIENVGPGRFWFYNVLGALVVVILFTLTTHFRIKA